MKKFEQLPHTADIKIRVYGKTKEELFRNSLYGMFSIVGPHVPSSCKKVGEYIVCDDLPKKHIVEVMAPDIDALLVDFLSEALYLSDVHNQAYFDVAIDQLTDTNIKAVIKGVAITGFDVVEIKAVTYHDLVIKHVDDVWQTDIVFDI
ncbi:archease [Candidatus Dependentiae bacterium]|nr:archease [Candidatus Dependentiae bacterium]